MIYCLFSIDNLYDQPSNNLVMWWSKKPSIEFVAKALKVDMAKAPDETIAAVVSVWLGKPTRINETEYFMAEVLEATHV